MVGSLGPAYIDNGAELGSGWQVLPADCPQNFAPAPAAQSVSGAPGFFPQALAAGQTMRLNVVAFPPDPCIGVLSFADKNGLGLGASMPLRSTNPMTADHLGVPGKCGGL